VVDGGWYSMPRPSCYNPGKGHITHRTGGWMGKKDWLRWVQKFLLPLEFQPQTVQPTVSHNTHYTFQL